MLVSRSMRYLASHCRPAPLYTRPIKTKTPGVKQIATAWYVKTPTTSAAYSTNPKDVFNSLLLIPHRMDSTAAPKPKIITPSNLDSQSKTVTPMTPLTPKPSIESPSLIPPSNVASHSISDNPPKQTKTPESQAESKNPMPPSKPPIPDSRLQPPNIKMPSREQVEKYFFTALVYVWDFSYYVFSLTLRLIDTYILKNPTLQENWKNLVKRLDEQRQAIKSKK